MATNYDELTRLVAEAANPRNSDEDKAFKAMEAIHFLDRIEGKSEKLHILLQSARVALLDIKNRVPKHE